MAKVKRKIIVIDEDKCDGCGLCIPSCPEGALAIIDGKARLVKEDFCDGLGACIGECPQGALVIEEREVEDYDEEGVIAHLSEKSPELVKKHIEHLRAHAEEVPEHHSHHGITVCPSAQVMQWEEVKEEQKVIEIPPEEAKEEERISSELRQWPVQLHLVPPFAPYFKNADIALIADCVPFAYANFHTDLLRGKAIAIGCPKLDDVNAYLSKITQILANNDVKSLTVVIMEVPCCYGLVHVARQALEQSGKNIPFEEVVIGIKGDLLKRVGSGLEL